MPNLETESVAAPDARWWRRAAAIVLVMAAVILFARLGSRALWASEFRWAEISREMILSGNYFWPTIDGRVYYDKPLGTYWLVIGATHLTRAMDETAARIPSAVAGLLSILLLILLARRLFDWPTGVLSGLILATSYSFVFFSRHASADVETIAGELLALILFIRHEHDSEFAPAGWWVLGLWIVMAITSLTKGLLGFVPPPLIIGAYCLLADGWSEFFRGILRGPISDRIRWFTRRNRWFFNWKTIPAIVIGGLIYAAPFIVSRYRMNSDRGLYLVYRENVLRYFEPFDHRGPIYLYFFVIFMLMAPWSVLLPAAIARIHNVLQRTNGVTSDPVNARHNRFVTIYFWATFLFFTFSGSRRSYYLLPILPAAAMIIARLLVSGPATLNRLDRMLMRIGYLILAGASLLAVVLVFPPQLVLPTPWSALPPIPGQIIFAIFWLISAFGIFYAMKNLTARRIAISTGIIAYLMIFYVYLIAMPVTEAYRPEKDFANVVTAKVGPGLNGLGFYRNLETFFYLNPPRPIGEYDNQWALHKAINNGDVKWLLIKRKEADDLKIGGDIVAQEPVYPWEGDKGIRNQILLIKVAPSRTPG